MKKQDYTTSIIVNATAEEAFKSINSISKWWTEDLEGCSEKPGDIFTVRFGETYVTAKVTELLPGRKIVWLVTDCNKPWLKDKKEWKGTEMCWEISEKENKTEIRFTHRGLVPGIECYGVCSDAWGQYIKQSLLKLVNTGKGQPTPKEKKTKKD